VSSAILENLRIVLNSTIVTLNGFSPIHPILKPNETAKILTRSYIIPCEFSSDLAFTLNVDAIWNNSNNILRSEALSSIKLKHQLDSNGPIMESSSYSMEGNVVESYACIPSLLDARNPGYPYHCALEFSARFSDLSWATKKSFDLVKGSVVEVESQTRRATIDVRSCSRLSFAKTLRIISERIPCDVNVLADITNGKCISALDRALAVLTEEANHECIKKHIENDNEMIAWWIKRLSLILETEKIILQLLEPPMFIL